MLTDFRGTPVKPGALIVYAVKASTYPYIREAIVEEVAEIPSPGNAQRYKITARPTGRGSESWRAVGGEQTLVTLKAVDRLVVIRESTR